MEKEVKIIIVLCSILILGCSASFVVSKGDNNVIDTQISTEPTTDIKLDSVGIIPKRKNK